jgi:hypothetical protein
MLMLMLMFGSSFCMSRAPHVGGARSAVGSEARGLEGRMSCRAGAGCGESGRGGERRGDCDWERKVWERGSWHVECVRRAFISGGCVCLQSSQVPRR